MVKISDLMTIAQVAELHGIGETQVKTAIRDRRLRAHLIGGRYLVERPSVVAFEPRRGPGRPAGRRDSYPRKRRTRAEMMAAL